MDIECAKKKKRFIYCSSCNYKSLEKPTLDGNNNNNNSNNTIFNINEKIIKTKPHLGYDLFIINWLSRINL